MASVSHGHKHTSELRIGGTAGYYDRCEHCERHDVLRPSLLGCQNTRRVQRGTFGEFNTGRKKNPKFLEEVLSTFKKEDNIIVGCRSGVRSLQASADLLNSGFKSIKNMEGGYIAWVAKGFAVKQPQESA